MHAGSQDSATDIQEQLHQADSPSVEPCVFTAIHHFCNNIPQTQRGTEFIFAAPSVFSIFGVVYLITAIAYILIRNVRKDCRCLKVIWIVDIAYFIGGILYYAGRNVRILVETLPNYFCSPTVTSSCQQSLKITQSFLLGTVVVFYWFIPFFISKYYQSNLAKEHQITEAKLQLVPEWILAAESLTLLVEFDALYTVMMNSFSTVTTTTSLFSCESGSQGIAAWVLWALFVLMYVFILYYTINIQYCGNCNVNRSCVTSNLGAIVPLAAFGMYLLTNNFVPLTCFPIPLLDIIITWIVMKILVLIVVITAIVLLLVYHCLSKTRQKKLLPHALYQHLHSDHEEQNDLPLETVDTNDVKL